MENYNGKICPFCKTKIKEGAKVKVCPTCGQNADLLVDAGVNAATNQFNADPRRKTR